MCNCKPENWFKCKGCLREMIVEKNVFNDVYKGQPLCVKCRLKKDNRNLKNIEAMALLAEDTLDKVK